MASEQAKKIIQRLDKVLVPYEGSTEVILNAEDYPMGDADRKKILSHFRGGGWTIEMMTRTEKGRAVHHAKLTLAEYTSKGAGTNLSAT